MSEPHKNYSLEDVSRMTFAQLAAIDDPLSLMGAGGTAPVTLRYAIRTGQLESLFPGKTMAELLRVITHAAPIVMDRWTFHVQQTMPGGEQDDEVDSYLKALAAEVENFT